jgi:hypothetical protein
MTDTIGAVNVRLFAPAISYARDFQRRAPAFGRTLVVVGCGLIVPFAWFGSQTRGWPRAPSRQCPARPVRPNAKLGSRVGHDRGGYIAWPSLPRH